MTTPEMDPADVLASQLWDRHQLKFPEDMRLPWAGLLTNAGPVGVQRGEDFRDLARIATATAAKVCRDLAQQVRDSNTHRGRVSAPGVFAAQRLEAAEDAILALAPPPLSKPARDR